MNLWFEVGFTVIFDSNLWFQAGFTVRFILYMFFNQILQSSTRTRPKEPWSTSFAKWGVREKCDE